MAEKAVVKDKSKIVEKPAVSPATFVKQVRQEAGKVTWPSRKEVTITTAMVFWMVLIVTLFMFVIDWSLQHGIRTLFSFFA